MDKPIVGCLGEFAHKEGDAIIYVDLVDGTYIIGTVCNTGICPIVSVPYDSGFTHCQHIEIINELLMNEGYFPL